MGDKAAIRLSEVLFEKQDAPYFHVTTRRRLQSILRHGLKVSKPSDMEDVAGVYMFEDKSTMEDALMNWLLDRFNEDDELVAIQVNPEFVTELNDVDTAGFEVISRTDIPKEGIVGYEAI